MERSFFTLEPGMWVAWCNEHGYFIAQVHGNVFETTGGQIVGCWPSKPSEEIEREAVLVARRASVAEWHTQEA